MSIWNKTSCSQQGATIRTYYEKNGVLDIRVFCAQWIEEQLRERIFESIDNVNPQTAYLFLKALTDHIETSMYNEPLKFQLQAIDPLALYKTLLIGFQTEYQLFTANAEEPIPQNNPFYPIFIELRDINLNVDQLKEKIMRCTNVFQSPNECPQIVLALEQILQRYDEVHKIVIDQKIKEWQRSQALAGNGAPLPDNLKDIQTCIETLLQILRKLFEYAQVLVQLNICTPEEGAKLHRIGDRLTIIREHIIVSSFIVEKQPPQVMKTNTRFAATVRWLIGSEFCNDIPNNNTVVECYILSEQQAQKFCKQPSNFGDAGPSSNLMGFPGTSGEIQHNTCNLEYNQQANVCLGQFRNMQLKKIKRAEKKGTESVMDEKFTLLFVTTVVRNNYRIRAWTLSLPVVVIVHGNQEPQSWATVTWDNAFSEIGRVPFVVPEQVGWELISSALNTKFASATGRPLTEDNLKFLYEKLFQYEMAGDAKGYVTWTQFCKEPIRDRSFTFWEWFYAIIKITKDQLAMAWKEGRIVGFINKTKVSDALSAHPVGTFLLRFSDSELGGITVNVKGANQLLMLQPWTAKDLTVRSLALRIRDLYENRSAQVKFLYQGPYENPISIEEAFPSEPTEPPATVVNTGYISTTVQVVASQDRIQQQQQQQLQQLQQHQQIPPQQFIQSPSIQSPNAMDLPMNPSEEFIEDANFDFNDFQNYQV